MQITHIRVENIKGCELADITTSAGTTIVGGKNHQGKSSFLDAVAMALGGKKLFPPDPIKEGEDEGEITIALDGGTDLLPWPCQINRLIRRRDDGTTYTTRVEITAEDGSVAPSPQTLLNSIIGNGLSFDPLAFVNMAPRDQANMLRELVGLDFTKLDTERSKLYEERTRVNRDVKQIDGKIKKTPIHTDVPSERIDISATLQQLTATNEHNQKMTGLETACDKLATRATALANRIKELESELTDVQAEFELLRNKIEPKISTAELQETLATAEEVNRKLRENEQRLDLIGTKKLGERQARQLSKQIDKIDKEKKRLASEADWPIEGLGFGIDGVAYNSISFAQLSSSEQLEVSVAIAMSLNPDFPFTVVRDGSLLDEDSLAELVGIVAKHGGQCLLERVSTGDEVHIVFEGGRGQVVEDPQQ